MMSRSVCKIDGCESFVLSRGLCNAHYRMERRNGDPLKRKGLTPGTVREWLSAHVDYEGDECLVFRIAGMKVRRCVVVEAHRDCDAKELADPWH